MLPTIACAAGESMLLTFDGKHVFACDAETGAPLWQLVLPARAVGIVFASPQAFAPGPGASPWRSGMSGSAAVALDAAGGLHCLDAAAGRLVRSLEAGGEATALASVNDAFALATAEKVLLWRDGVKREITEKGVTALGFATDGTLAMGTRSGAVVVLDGETHQLGGPVRSLAWSTRTGWLAGTDHGLFTVTRRTKLLDGRIRALAVDPANGNVALPRGDQTVMVYDWPIGTTALTKVIVAKRAIEGVAFGPSGRLGVGLNRGDAAIVDLVAQTGKQAEPQPGKESRPWELEVGSDPARRPTPSGKGFSKAAGLSTAGLLAVGARVIFVAMRSSSPAPYVPPVDLSKVLQCDITCESGRLAELRKVCQAATAIDCKAEAEAAEQSFMVSDCDSARQSLAQVENKILTGSETSGVYTDLILAKQGLGLACKQDVKDGVVTFTGEALHPQQRELWSSNGGNLGQPFGLAVDGAGHAFVTVVNHTSRNCEIWRISGLMDFEPLADECTSAQMFARGDDVFVAAGTTVRRFSGGTSSEIGWKGADAVLAITGAPDPDGDLWVTTVTNELMQRHAGKWRTDPLPSGNANSSDPHLVLGALGFVEDTLLLGATDPFGKHFLYRQQKGSWSKTESAFGVDPIYVAPDETVYVGRGKELAISHDKGATWTNIDVPFQVKAVWAARGKAYVAGSDGLAIWDGKQLQRTGFGQPLTALTGESGGPIYGIVAH